MMRSVLSPLALFSLSLLALVACGGTTPAPAGPPKAAPVEGRPPVPPCPEAILPGGDPLEAESFEGKPVVRICVVGGNEESKRNAQRAIEVRPNDVYSADRVRADLDAIMKQGAFDDVAAHGLVVQQGASMVLFYSIHERPRIASIVFEGAKVLGDAALNAKLPIMKDSPYDPAKVNVITEAVREEYRGRGYDACKVSLVAEPAGPDQVRVRLKVEEGPLLKLTKIDFRGNKKVSEADLRKAAGLKLGQAFVQDELDRAGLLLNALYYDRGFVQVHVVTESVATAGGAGGLSIAFVIEEGEPFFIGTLRATKLGAPVEKELFTKVMKARPKQLFSRASIVEDIQRVQAFFEGRGQKVEVNPQTELDAKKHTVDLTFEIEAK